MKLSHIILFFTLTLAFSLSSCRKGPGPGGKAQITGKVYEKEYNSTFTSVLNEYYVADQDVYIIYGDDETYSDKTSTSFDGTYKFDYLLPGEYTIFVYSKDETGAEPSGEKTIFKEVGITKRNEEVRVSDFIIADN